MSQNTCCGVTVSTPFCPHCGKKLKDAPAVALLGYLQSQLKKAEKKVLELYGKAGSSKFPTNLVSRLPIMPSPVTSGWTSVTPEEGRKAAEEYLKWDGWARVLGEMIARLGPDVVNTLSSDPPPDDQPPQPPTRRRGLEI